MEQTIIKNRYTGEVMLEGQPLESILGMHKPWLLGKEGGRRACLRGANLIGANLSGASLGSANLSHANLSGADLSEADLSHANLSEADLSHANLSDASLIGANLSGADLRGADLSEADLCGANMNGISLEDTIGNKLQVKSLQLERYSIAYTALDLQIGCKVYDISQWWAFDDITIEQMDKGALDWWKKWKPILQQIIEASPATPTGRGKAGK